MIEGVSQHQTEITTTTPQKTSSIRVQGWGFRETSSRYQRFIFPLFPSRSSGWAFVNGNRGSCSIFFFVVAREDFYCVIFVTFILHHPLPPNRPCVDCMMFVERPRKSGKGYASSLSLCIVSPGTNDVMMDDDYERGGGGAKTKEKSKGSDGTWMGWTRGGKANEGGSPPLFPRDNLPL